MVGICIREKMKKKHSRLKIYSFKYVTLYANSVEKLIVMLKWPLQNLNKNTKGSNNNIV